MPKLNLYEIKHSGYLVFNTKAEMLKYIRKSSFRKDKWGYTHYEMQITYKSKKWIVHWR